MSGVARYRITACCGNQGSTLTSFGTTGGIFQNGLHISTQDVQLDGGFIIEAGQCYTIIQLSSGPIVNPVDYGIFINIELGAEEDCSLYDTTGCECPWLYYISPCCREFGDQGISAQQVNLALSDLEYEDGTYQYTGPETLDIPNTNLTLEPGQCYTITRRQVAPIQTLIELNFASTSWQVMNLELGCDDGRCQDCPEEGIAYLKYEPCCDRFDTIYVQTRTYTGAGMNSAPEPIVNTAGYTGVFQFVATTQVSQLSAFIPGQCYTGTLHTLGTEVAPAPQDNADYNNLPLAPYSTQLSKVGDCERPPCPECRPTVYSLTNCEGITLNTETDVSAYIGTYVELDSIPGCWFVQEYSAINDIKDPTVISPKPGKIAASDQLINTLPGLQTQPVTVIGSCDCECKCYEVIGYTGTYSYVDCETGKSLLVFSSGADKFCAATRPNIVGKEGIDYTLIIGEDCVDGECVDKCFLLTNCDPTAYPNQDATLDSTLQSLSQYANTGEVVVLSGYEGCWTVTEKTCSCITITIDGTPIEALATSTYNDQSVFTFEYNNLIYSIWFDARWFITLVPGDFSNLIASTVSVDNCPVFGSIDDPVNPDPAGWRSSPSGTIITTALCDDQCDCPVDVTVIRNYVDCDDCLGITAYKLSNCEKINEVIYTTQDLSAYVGQVVKDDCACWTVEQIDYQPPSETTIVDPILFEDCNTCLTTYYQLDDCDTTSSVPIIITSTNLAAYVGRVIQIDGCTGCYTVSLYAPETQPPNSQEVTLTLDFADCTTCGTTVPKCSTVFNNTTADQTYTFINANGDAEVTDVVKSGHSSLRYCVQRWDDSINPDGIFNFYGDCTVYEDELRVKTGFCVQYFPNNRKVRPGYNTPICSADKYDKITCNAADIMYKKVLELRYGISDCCPEENEKWLIKKELIELQALTDPNYTCDHLSDCSCNS